MNYMSKASFWQTAWKNKTRSRRGNSHNGKSQKKLKGEVGEMLIEVPRDRNGTFEPQLIEKQQTRLKAWRPRLYDVGAGHDSARHSEPLARPT